MEVVRMSNIIAGVVRGQLPWIDEHIRQKKEIWSRYQEGFKDLPVVMNPFESCASPNFWLSCMLIDEDAMCETVRSSSKAMYRSERNKSCPTEILAAISAFNAEGRPIWKPMHMQPMYRNNVFVTVQGVNRGRTNAYIDEGRTVDVGRDIFNRGLCLPSDNKMSAGEQERVIEIIKRCFE